MANARFEVGDAFSQEELAGSTPRPNVAVVSGLYELFPDNGPIERSLAGLAAAIEEGGYLVYTNQPWHPQIEMIARTLSNRDGAAVGDAAADAVGDGRAGAARRGLSRIACGLTGGDLHRVASAARAAMSVIALPESRDCAAYVGGGRLDVAAYHGAFAIGCALVAVLMRAWRGAWSAGCFKHVGRDGIRDGMVGVFGKGHGVLPVWSLILFGPHLLGLRMAWWMQSYGRTPCSELLPGLWIGRRPGHDDSRSWTVAACARRLTSRQSCRNAGRGAAMAIPTCRFSDLTMPDVATLERGGRDHCRCDDARGRVRSLCAGIWADSGGGGGVFAGERWAGSVEAAAAGCARAGRGAVYPPGARRVLEAYARD